MRRRRLDQELVRRGMADSRTRAADLIASGRVRVNGMPADKAARQVGEGESISVIQDEETWASRGAHKLLSALDVFTEQGMRPPVGRRCLDAGASTGGFTDVLLRRGAAAVIAVDVGYGQLLWRLADDPRVTVLDRCNVRTLPDQSLPYRPDLVVADLSFISLRTVIPALAAIVDPEADLLLMVKPQFEVGRDRVGKKGIVRDPELRAEAVREVCRAAARHGLGAVSVSASGLPGPGGNVEYFVWLRVGEQLVGEDEIKRAVQEGPR